MSKIEVNQISSQCGSTLTVGQSGDTVTLASGASQTGFGRTGTVDWQTSIKTSGFTATNGEGYFINTTSGAITMTLPASPSVGDIVAVKDYANTFDTNNLTIDRNGQPISGTAANAVISTEGQSLTLIYGDATKGWQVVYAATEADLPKPSFITASGGNSCGTVGDYKFHVFTSPGTFTVSNAGNAIGSNTVTATVVAGGSGGGSRHGGGGASGGLTVGQSIPVTATGFPIAIGGGGAGAPGPSSRSSAGSNSTGFSYVAIGGGQAGSQGPTPTGLPGGSGGGAAVGGAGGSSGPNPGGSATQPGQSQPPTVVFNAGNAGGAGGVNPGPDDGGGGGGGAGGAGVPSSAPTNPSTYSNGGAGKDISPFVNAAPGYPLTIYAGGGGGGANNNPAGGQGGGTPVPADRGGGGPGGNPGVGGNPGIANTGGGGGASGAGPIAGSAGGSGIVIIEYKFQ
jgi:hypothetical protein